MGKQKTVDMTDGNISKQLIGFTVPLILGNIFQLAYNIVDSIVVGQFAGKEALAACGTSDPIMNMLILGISGLCIGASVLMSRYFGAGETEKLKKEAAMTLSVVMCFSFLIMIGCGFCIDWIFEIMCVPSEVAPQASSYMSIIFIGMPFTCLYNVYAASLRSVGDSKTPIRFLMIASVLNACMDVILVGVFHLGIAGAAWATVCAEAVSAILCIGYVYRFVPILHLERKYFHIDLAMIRETLQLGGMSSLQQCSQPIGKLLIQGVINTMGVSAIAAFTIVGKIEDVGLVPGRSISNAMMTFTAQNYGAGKRERIQKGFQKGILLELFAAVCICIFLIVLDRPLLSAFHSDEEIIQEGLRYFSLMAFFYWLPGMSNGHQGFFRGMGKMRITLLGTITQISLRVLCTFLLVPHLGIFGVGLACIIGWSIQLFWQSIYRYYMMK